MVEGSKVTHFLKMPDGTPIVPTGMDSSGRILGYYRGPGDGEDHPVVIDHGTITQAKDLGLGARIVGINAAGDVAGTATTTSNFGYWTKHAYAVLGGVSHDLGTLGTLGDGSFSVATAINDLGEVVGHADSQSLSNTHNLSPLDLAKLQHAFLYDSGKMIDLNSLVSPAMHLTLTDAISINNKGQILVEGYYGSNYEESSYLLTPVTMFAPAAVTTAPEPTSLAILGLGAVLVGFRRRSRGPA